jgi:hypothetical protein
MGVLVFGFAANALAQEILPEVTVLATNYKYLKSANTKSVADPANLLERKAAAYDIKKSEYYDDDYDTYSIRFYLPDGYVLAVYDKDGKLLRTAERYKDISLPVAVRNTIADRYPKWTITRDVYQLKYEDAQGARMVYKLVLQNGSKQIKVKTDDRGQILD